MPKAEVGSTKYLNNKLKSKGLQRLRWYCQVCERQMRDENGFKCHVASESHVRQMLVVGENSAKFISDYSGQFQRDFLQLLRTSHGEKKVNLNHFYQEYIRNKEHIHMNATRWTSLTEFGKYLGREGICRVDEGDRGLEVSWIDNSPEALRRQDAIRKKERQDKGDEEREQRLIAEQVERAQRDAEAKQIPGESEEKGLQRQDGERITLNFGTKPALIPKQTISPPLSYQDSNTLPAKPSDTLSPVPVPELSNDSSNLNNKIPLKISSTKLKNVFSSGSKKNVLAGSKATNSNFSKKPMSETERIMKEEIERKRVRETSLSIEPGSKRART